MDTLPGHRGTYDQSLSQRGFTLVELMIVVSLIGLLASIALPAFAHARTRTQEELCAFNLRRIDIEKVHWALEHRVGSGVQPSEEDLAPYFMRDRFPTCPGGGFYDLGKVKDPTECSLKDQGHFVAE